MSIQTCILIILCYYYNGIISGVVIFPVLYSVFVYILTCGVVPIDLHTKMQVGILPIISFSKVSNAVPLLYLLFHAVLDFYSGGRVRAISYASKDPRLEIALAINIYTGALDRQRMVLFSP